MGYDEKSNDAMFARLLQRLDSQDQVSAIYRAEVKGSLDYIKQAVDKTNGRVTILEGWRDVVSAKVAVIAVVVSGAVGLTGWAITILYGQ